MKLRTFTGLEKEAQCACGCGQRIPANPDIRVVVDMEGWPRKRYLPSHAPEQPRYQGARKKEEVKPAPSPASPAPAGPAPAGPQPASPQPQVEPTPVPTPKVVVGTAPSLADNRPWKILQVTISVGDYTSVKAGVADFGRENETMAQLGSRLVAELTSDIKTELDVVHQVQQGKPLSVPTQGAITAPTTSSSASAGAPARRCVVGPEMMETRRLISMELESDASVVRSLKKRKAGNQWLKAHGYESFDQVLPTDLEALKGLLVQFEAINAAPDVPQRPQPPQGLTPSSSAAFS